MCATTPGKPMGIQEQSSGINYVGETTEDESEPETLWLRKTCWKKT